MSHIFSTFIKALNQKHEIYFVLLLFWSDNLYFHTVQTSMPLISKQ